MDIYMEITLTEPRDPKYIYINPVNNMIELLVPVVGGQSISTDNTCKTTVASDVFFKGEALDELNIYKSALAFDLKLLADDDVALSDIKKHRLAQINAYIAAVSVMRESYSTLIATQRQVLSNLYSIQLRPHEQDHYSSVINPVFSIDRRNDATGTPLSELYKALYEVLPHIEAPFTPQKRLEDGVMDKLKSQPITFEIIQQVLTTEFQDLFGLNVDFTQDSKGILVDQAYIDSVMGFTAEHPGSAEEYIEALLNVCAVDIWYSIPTSAFYSIHGDKTEQLSILTQFCLAHVNIHCVENGISFQNFGAILDKSEILSKNVASIVVDSLKEGETVEDNLCGFFNKHAAEFGLSRPLSTEDIDAIKQRFAANYLTVKDSPHMDDFMILNTATDTGQYVTHQGSICTYFFELVKGSTLDDPFFEAMRADFEKPQTCFIPHQNLHIQASIDLDIKTLLSRVTDDEQMKRLDLDPGSWEQLLASADFQIRQFLLNIAHGKQQEAELQLIENPCLLLASGHFTDYSGRTFTCTAYEYAYWAKDTHMCRMLEAHMNEETKAAMLNYIQAIDQDGLNYQQWGEAGLEFKKSTHFDMKPLIQALEDYVDGYKRRKLMGDFKTLEPEWLRVGIAQRELPVHVINEYCRVDKSFVPLPEFNDMSLPRIVSYDSFGENASLFPLVTSGSNILGVHFSLLRGGNIDKAVSARGEGNETCALLDLAALIKLDQVRTEELEISLANLSKHGSALKP